MDKKLRIVDNLAHRIEKAEEEGRVMTFLPRTVREWKNYTTRMESNIKKLAWETVRYFEGLSLDDKDVPPYPLVLARRVMKSFEKKAEDG